MLAFLHRLLLSERTSIRRRRDITAAEFIKQVENDPEYLAKSREMAIAREALRRRCEADERQLVGELRGLGLEVASVYDLVNNKPHPFLPRTFVGSYREAYAVLLKHLQISHESNIREGIIRALTVRDLPEEAHPVLLEQFRAETNRIHRVCLALACRRAMGRRMAAAHPEIAAAIHGGMLETERQKEGQ